MTVLNIQSLFITHVSGISVLCPVVSLSSREAWTSYTEAQGSTREYPKSEHSKREERKLLVLLKARSRTGTVSLIPPLQYSCLENPMDGGACWAAVHGVAKSRTRLSDFTFAFHFYALEKEMATHSSVLAWSIPGTGEPGGLPSMGSHRVGHD